MAALPFYCKMRGWSKKPSPLRQQHLLCSEWQEPVDKLISLDTILLYWSVTLNSNNTEKENGHALLCASKPTRLVRHTHTHGCHMSKIIPHCLSSCLYWYWTPWAWSFVWSRHMFKHILYYKLLQAGGRYPAYNRDGGISNVLEDTGFFAGCFWYWIRLSPSKGTHMPIRNCRTAIRISPFLKWPVIGQSPKSLAKFSKAWKQSQEEMKK